MSSSAAFLSTPSARRATWYLCVLAVCALFLSTPSARRATAPTPEEGWIHQNISIHALREEGDRLNRVRLAFIFDFYPRPPRGGRRPEKSRSSTAVLYFYPRPPRGGRLAGIFGGWGQTGISIHALREEGDVFDVARVCASVVFLSTPSARRATVPEYLGGGRYHVFLSTPSARRATRATSKTNYMQSQFLSTPSARRATVHIERNQFACIISIHALREEGDHPGCQQKHTKYRFLSTPSARRATIRISPLLRVRRNFYPRPPRGGRLLFPHFFA